jgi:hypothetical protein
MNQLHHMKFRELFIEFTRYLTEHPEFSRHIPQDAQVVLLDRHDPQYSLYAMQCAQRAKQTDEVKNRPVVYIEVREMAPITSRLRRVKVLKSPPAYVTA